MIHDVGKRLVEAAPRELAIGNIVRRILGLIRDEEDENREDDGLSTPSDGGSEPVSPRSETPTSIPPLPSIAAAFGNAIYPRREAAHSPSPQRTPSARPPLLSSHTGAPGTTRPPVTSMFSIMAHPLMRTGTSSSPMRSGSSTPLTDRPSSKLRDEVLEGISEIIDELDQTDEQIASYALEHIHPYETLFTYSSSLTVQRFLLKAASKRKFTVIHAEAYPNTHRKTHALVTGNFDNEDEDLEAESFQKPLTAAGITVILIPDSSIFALMSRANKVILGAHAVLENGSLVSACGTKAVVKAARFHRVPIIVLTGTYKLSPRYPHDPHEFVEYGDVQRVIPFQDNEMRKGLESVKNPVYDFVEAGEVDLFVTNLGGISTGYLYRVIRDQYRDEDLEL